MTEYEFADAVVAVLKKQFGENADVEQRRGELPDYDAVRLTFNVMVGGEWRARYAFDLPNGYPHDVADAFAAFNARAVT